MTAPLKRAGSVPIPRLAVPLLAFLLLSSRPARAQSGPSDPLLAPVPAPRTTLHTWADAASVLRARSTDLVIAAADLDRAEADSRAALGALLGTIRLDGSYTFNILTTESAQISGISRAGVPTFETLTLPQRSYVTGVTTATLPVIAPRAWVAIKSASLREDAARADLENVRRRLRQDLANTIVASVVAERTVELSRAALASALERVALVTEKKTLGGGTVLDVVRGQQDLEAARAQVVSAVESLRQEREALGLALGLKEEVAVDPGLHLDDAIREVQSACRQLPSVEQRPDVVAVAKRVDVAHQVVRDADAEFFPTVSVQSVFTPTNDNLVPYPSTQWYVAGLISWNLWDGGQRYADLRSGAAQERAAAARLEQADRNATVEVSRARRAVTVAESSRAVAERENDFAARQELLTRTAYQTGQGTSLELVTAAAAHRAQEIGLVLREYDVVRARMNALFVQSACTL